MHSLEEHFIVSYAVTAAAGRQRPQYPILNSFLAIWETLSLVPMKRNSYLGWDALQELLNCRFGECNTILTSGFLYGFLWSFRPPEYTHSADSKLCGSMFECKLRDRCVISNEEFIEFCIKPRVNHI